MTEQEIEELKKELDYYKKCYEMIKAIMQMHDNG